MVRAVSDCHHAAAAVGRLPVIRPAAPLTISTSSENPLGLGEMLPSVVLCVRPKLCCKLSDFCQKLLNRQMYIFGEYLIKVFSSQMFAGRIVHSRVQIFYE